MIVTQKLLPVIGNPSRRRPTYTPSLLSSLSPVRRPISDAAAVVTPLGSTQAAIRQRALMHQKDFWLKREGGILGSILVRPCFRTLMAFQKKALPTSSARPSLCIS